MMDLLWLFIFHFVADFLLQSRTMGKKKSEDWSYLGSHFLILAGVFFFGTWALTSLTIYQSFCFSFWNGIIHTLFIDKWVWLPYKWNVRRKNPTIPLPQLIKEYKYWEDKTFFDTIGFDQMLHNITMVVLFYLCK